MLTEKKYKILVWSVVVLVILNISTIGSILLHINNPKLINQGINTSASQELPYKVQKRMNYFLYDELELTSEQSVAFNTHHEAFKVEAHQIAIHMKVLRDEMLNELMLDEPDEVHLQKLSEEIGDAHKELKVNTYHFFLELKEVCTPEQSIKLEKLFRTIMQADPPPGRGRRGNGYQHRRGQKRNHPRWMNDTIN